MFADRFSTIREIQPHISPPPADWINHVDNNIRERIDEASLTCIDLDRYLRLAYDQDDAQLIDIGDDEDDYQIEEYKKPKRGVVDAELDALSYTISGLLVMALRQEEHRRPCCAVRGSEGMELRI
jgi:serine/threonine-protein kinase SRPK3